MMDFLELTNRSVFCNGHYGNKYHLPALAIFTAVMYGFLSVATTLANILILVALRRENSLNPPSKLLLLNLTITDLCAGFISQSVSIALTRTGISQSTFEECRLLEYVAFLLSTIFSGVSLSTITAISVNRLMASALLLGIRYRQVVTIKRVRIIVFLPWVQCALLGAVSFWSIRAFAIASGVTIMLMITISTYSYTRTFHYFRCRRKAVQDHGCQGAGTKLMMARYKKTVINSLWVHLTLMSCYLPFTLVTVITLIRGLNLTLFVAHVFAVVLVNLNSLLNPILYCWKIKEIQRAVKETLRQFCTCFVA